MVGSIQSNRPGPKIDRPVAAAATEESRSVKDPAAKPPRPVKKAAAARPDSFTRSPAAGGKKAEAGKRATSKKADKASFKKKPGLAKGKRGEAASKAKGSTAAKAASASGPAKAAAAGATGKAAGTAEAGKTTGASEIGKTAAKLGLSVQQAIEKITGLFSSDKADDRQAREATGIIRSFKEAKALGSVLNGIKGDTLQDLLLESKPGNRKDLVGHVAEHGGKIAKDTLAGGIQKEIHRIKQEGTDWIKHPATRSHDGPTKKDGSGGKPRIEIDVRRDEIGHLHKMSSTIRSGDKGSGPIG